MWELSLKLYIICGTSSTAFLANRLSTTCNSARARVLVKSDVVWTWVSSATEQVSNFWERISHGIARPESGLASAAGRAASAEFWFSYPRESAPPNLSTSRTYSVDGEVKRQTRWRKRRARSGRGRAMASSSPTKDLQETLKKTASNAVLHQ
jgi:hypothetical protein